jgi:hypothetical protein
MPEVATDEVVESQEGEAPEAVAPATPDPAELTTLQKRLAGKDQALTAAIRERDELRKEREALARWKSEKEGADLSETEKLQKRLAELEQEANSAKAEAARARLAKQFPLASDLLGDDLPLDEVRAAEIEGRLKAAIAASEAEDAEPEPRVDTNRPRRATSATTRKGPRPLDEIKADMKAAFDLEFPGYGGG